MNVIEKKKWSQKKWKNKSMLIPVTDKSNKLIGWKNGGDTTEKWSPTTKNSKKNWNPVSSNYFANIVKKVELLEILAG